MLPMVKSIELTKGYAALVDDEDYEAIAQYSWYAHEAPHTPVVYAIRRTRCPTTRGQKTYRMHRQILGILDDLSIMIDHVDMDGLNNTRSNLRIVEPTQNQANTVVKYRDGRTSIYKGVYFNRNAGKWHASIRAWGERKNLGLFKCEKAAARAYNAAALAAWGDNSRLNIIK